MDAVKSRKHASMIWRDDTWRFWGNPRRKTRGDPRRNKQRASRNQRRRVCTRQHQDAIQYIRIGRKQPLDCDASALVARAGLVRDEGEHEDQRESEARAAHQFAHQSAKANASAQHEEVREIHFYTLQHEKLKLRDPTNLPQFYLSTSVRTNSTRLRVTPRDCASRWATHNSAHIRTLNQSTHSAAPQDPRHSHCHHDSHPPVHRCFPNCSA